MLEFLIYALTEKIEQYNHNPSPELDYDIKRIEAEICKLMKC
jgi:hypothetical protein